MEIKLRRACEKECHLLFEWVNDEAVRQNSFNCSSISYDEHQRWFKNKLDSDGSYIYIGMADGKPVGQIRVDVEDDTGIISYSVDSSFRGMGCGTGLLEGVIDILKAEGIGVSKVVGRVKYQNIPSRKAFEKAGYTSCEHKEYVEYCKTL